MEKSNLYLIVLFELIFVILLTEILNVINISNNSVYILLVLGVAYLFTQSDNIIKEIMHIEYDKFIFKKKWLEVVIDVYRVIIKLLYAFFIYKFFILGLVEFIIFFTILNVMYITFLNVSFVDYISLTRWKRSE